MAVGTDARSTFLAIVKGDASQAVTEFKKLGNSVEKSTKGAEGSVGKFQKFTSGAMSELKANAGMMAAGAGAAIGAFALASINKFSDLGVAIGKFSDATGMATEDASRWVEVAGDIGIEMGTVEKALGRLNRTIDEQKFAELGIEIARTKDGATDVSETFLNVIDRLNGMKDPAERARVAQQLLGKGWQEMAELISQGSGTLRTSLAGVSDAKVFDRGEVQRARDVRAAMDKLKDVVDDLALTVGNELAPAFADLVENIADLAGPLSTAFRWMNKLNSYSPTNFIAWGKRLWDTATGAGEATGKLHLMSASVEDVQAWLDKANVTGDEANEVWAQYAHWQEVAAEAQRRVTDEIGTLNDANKTNAEQTWLLEQALSEAALASANLRDRVSEARSKLQDLQDQIDGDRSLVDLKSNLLDNAKKIDDLRKEFEDGKISAEDYFLGVAAASLDSKDAVADYFAELETVDGDIATNIVVNLDPSSPEVIFTTLDTALGKKRLHMGVDTFYTSPELKKLMEGGIVTAPGKIKVGVQGDVGYEKKARGGLTRGGLTLVGEEGPEFVNMPKGAYVHPAAESARMMAGALAGGGGGGGTVNLTMVVRQMPTERELIDLINGVRRKQGAVI